MVGLGRLPWMLRCLLSVWPAHSPTAGAVLRYSRDEIARKCHADQAFLLSYQEVGCSRAESVASEGHLRVSDGAMESQRACRQ